MPRQQQRYFWTSGLPDTALQPGCRHGTPARMQSNNATNFFPENAQKLMKASQVTKVTSFPDHTRGNGLLERQERTLLTLLRIHPEKSIPFSFMYPEFAVRQFESKEEFVEHLIARQQEVHELVHWYTHQPQLRPKQNIGGHFEAKAHGVGDAVWVFCHIIQRAVPDNFFVPDVDLTKSLTCYKMEDYTY